MLHYKIDGQGQPVVLLHGLFGSLDNLGVIARQLANNYQTVSLDLPNHGRSPHSDDVDYSDMATAVHNSLTKLGFDNYSVIGHSMGGKVAMRLAQLYPEALSKLVVLDMAPVAYTTARHTQVLKALNAVEAALPGSRSDALSIMGKHLDDAGVVQFLSKSLTKKEHATQGTVFGWRFNLLALEKEYWSILGWETQPENSVPTLMVVGGDSDYVQPQYQPQIVAQFPNAKAHVISGAGHWLHAEKPDQVARSIERFLSR